MRHAQTAASYQSEISNWVSRGFEPTLVESYRVGDSLRYAFIAEKRGAPGSAYHGRSAGDHQALANDYKGEGFSPVSVVVVSLKGKLYYTALWAKGVPGSVAAQLDALVERVPEVARDELEVRAPPRVRERLPPRRRAAVLRGRPDGRLGELRGAARADGGPYRTEYEKWTGQGLRTGRHGLPVRSSHRFAALWR
jgi:hypothetical protein